jgi:hypothetical protein
LALMDGSIYTTLTSAGYTLEADLTKAIQKSIDDAIKSGKIRVYADGTVRALGGGEGGRSLDITRELGAIGGAYVAANADGMSKPGWGFEDYSGAGTSPTVPKPTPTPTPYGYEKPPTDGGQPDATPAPAAAPVGRKMPKAPKTVDPRINPSGRDSGRTVVFNPETRIGGAGATRTSSSAIGSTGVRYGGFNAGIQSGSDMLLDGFMRNMPSATANATENKPTTKRTYRDITRRSF